MDQERESVKVKQARGIYLLPNLFTTAALFAGFYAIVAAMKGYFDDAAIAVFVAMVADTLDGRVARLTNTQTAFGAEYDSLSDMVAFGIAPALVAYSWSLVNLGKLGWLAAFIYVAGAALRLARFNTQPHDYDKRYFQGLPSTAAAPVIVSGVWLGYQYDVSGIFIAIITAFLTVLIAGFMVSNIRYYSFKQIDLKGKVPFIVLIVPVLVICAITLEPAEMLFGVFFCYAFSGPVVTLLQLRKMRKGKGKKFSSKS
jgi:CDP-diacylglycerol--serine O-phosphatidyltransferase